MTEQIAKQQKEALEEFVFTASVPLFNALGEDADHCATDGDADHCATGTFVETEEKLFLLTARHVLDECEPQDIGITCSPTDSDLFTLGNLIVHKPKDMCDAEIDIVAIEIQDQKMGDIIRSGWRVVNITIGEHQNTSASKFLVGYASDQLDRNGPNMYGKPISFNCSLYDPAPSTATQPINPKLDLFLEFPTAAAQKGGNSIEIGEIKGMSGCAIWEIHETKNEGIWAPEHALRLVGIQSSAVQGSFLRGKKWAYILKLLETARDR